MTSSLAAAGVSDLLKYFQALKSLSDGRFVQDRLTPLDIEKGTNLTHLKRVRKAGEKSEDGVDIIDIILCAASTLSGKEVGEIVEEAQERGIEIKPRLVKVSRWPAYTTKQLEEFKTLWPVALRKDTTRYCLFLVLLTVG